MELRKKLIWRQTCSRDEKLSGINEYLLFFFLSLNEEDLIFFSEVIVLLLPAELLLTEPEDGCLDMVEYL